MKKSLVLIFVLLISVFISAQSAQSENLAFLSFVKKDTVLLRWAPMIPRLLKKGLEYGYTIERTDGLGNLETFVIKPFDKSITLENEESQNFQQMIDGYVSSSSLSTSEDNYTFGVLILASSSNKELSRLLNLNFIDTKIKKGTEYKYRLKLNYNGVKSLSLSINSDKLSRSKNLTNLEGEADHKRKTAYLKWEAETLETDYSAYWIERSEDSINYKRITETPYMFFKSSDEPDKKEIDYIDQTVEEGNTYWYRVKGINHFAEIGEKSNTLKISMKHILKGIVKIDTIYANKFERVIKGKYEMTSDNDIKYLKRFVLLKSNEMHEGFTVFGESKVEMNTFDFRIDSKLLSGDRNYYKVGAISVDNDTVYSFTRYFFTLDQEPPGQPQNLSGIVDSNGVVSLNWDKNIELDIKGYRVFKSNSMKEEFVEITEYFADTNLYFDTIPLNNLTSSIYYRVAAVDLNFNNSIHSKEIKLIKPDTISPVACLFNLYQSEVNGMSLGWINSTSKDVKESQLIAREDFGNERNVLNWSDTLSSFTDSLALLGEKTTYYIKTLDESKNEVISNELTVFYETGKRPSISSLISEIDLVKKNIVLEWKAPKGEVYSYKIYRTKNDAPFRLLKTIRDSENYLDKDVAINNTYSYKVKVVYQSGIKSSFSEVLNVKY
jgi:fibronectin type 3 domain-containing protein